MTLVYTTVFLQPSSCCIKTTNAYSKINTAEGERLPAVYNRTLLSSHCHLSSLIFLHDHKRRSLSHDSWFYWHLTVFKGSSSALHPLVATGEGKWRRKEGEWRLFKGLAQKAMGVRPLNTPHNFKHIYCLSLHSLSLSLPHSLPHSVFFLSVSEEAKAWAELWTLREDKELVEGGLTQLSPCMRGCKTVAQAQIYWMCEDLDWPAGIAGKRTGEGMCFWII